MQEYELKVLEQYNIKVISTRKTRGAVLCDTDQGLLLLKDVTGQEKRIPVVWELHDYLRQQGVENTDEIILNQEGDSVSALEGEGTHILKRWFPGRECDLHRPAELLEATASLAKLHLLMQHQLELPAGTGTDLKEEYARHNRELRKVRKYMRKLSPKGEFEIAFLKCFDQMYQWASASLQELEQSGYDTLYKESVEGHCLVHGEYNYHNILMLPTARPARVEMPEIAVTNFEKFKYDVQVEDLYYFLRKVMEKTGWKTRLGDNMINAYSAVRPISDVEMEYLRNRLSYPEKIWKIANSYYHSNKAWVSVKNIEKLSTAIRQTEEKRRFLEEIFSFHL